MKDEARPSAIVEMWDLHRLAGNVSLAVDDSPLCPPIRLESSGRLRDLCTLSLPPEAREIRLDAWLGGKHISRRWEILDLAPITGPLRRPGKSFGQRLRDCEAAILEFERQHPEIQEQEWGSLSAGLTLGKPASLEEVEAVKRRLGFQLPPEHVSLLLEVGRLKLEIAEVSTFPSERIETAYDSFMADWLAPESRVEGFFAPAMAHLYRTSALLAIEYGDGYSGLICQHPGASASGTFELFWISQGDLHHPEPLRRGDGSPKSYVEAMIWLIVKTALDEYVQVPSWTVVDRSSPAPSRLRLDHFDEFELLHAAWSYDDRPPGAPVAYE